MLDFPDQFLDRERFADDGQLIDWHAPEQIVWEAEQNGKNDADANCPGCPQNIPGNFVNGGKQRMDGISGLPQLLLSTVFTELGKKNFLLGVQEVAIFRRTYRAPRIHSRHKCFVQFRHDNSARTKNHLLESRERRYIELSLTTTALGSRSLSKLWQFCGSPVSEFHGCAGISCLTNNHNRIVFLWLPRIGIRSKRAIRESPPLR